MSRITANEVGEHNQARAQGNELRSMQYQGTASSVGPEIGVRPARYPPFAGVLL
jgi:hypothetical protein